jgi:tetratricopeptide (TPR) repeat protein
MPARGLLAAPTRSAKTPEPTAEVQFSDALRVINMADAAARDGQFERALDLYREAYHAHTLLSEQFPQWNPDKVRSRTEHCVGRMNALSDVLDNKSEAAEASSGQDGATRPFAPPVDANSSKSATEESSSIPLLIKAPSGMPPEDVTAPAWVPDRAAEPEVESRSDPEPPPSLSVIKATAKRRIESGAFEGARTILLEGMRIDPDDKTIRLFLGLVQCRVGRFEDAASLLRTLLEETPDDANAHLYLAGALTGLGQMDAAAKELRLAIRYEPQMHQAHFNLAQILLRINPPDGTAAREHYTLSMKYGGQPDPELAKRLPSAPVH